MGNYQNEIGLLRYLANSKHVIKIIDSEISSEQSIIKIVLEYGESDLAKLLVCYCVSTIQILQTLHGGKFDENAIRHYWQSVLLAVQAVHEARIVHADLKPANFVLVEGTLRIIDFGNNTALPSTFLFCLGIAKKINQNTTNIVQESQVGTANYISPEALAEATANPIKVGNLLSVVNVSS